MWISGISKIDFEILRTLMNQMMYISELLKFKYLNFAFLPIERRGETK